MSFLPLSLFVGLCYCSILFTYTKINHEMIYAFPKWNGIAIVLFVAFGFCLFIGIFWAFSKIQVRLYCSKFFLEQKERNEFVLSRGLFFLSLFFLLGCRLEEIYCLGIEILRVQNPINGLDFMNSAHRTPHLLLQYNTIEFYKRVFLISEKMEFFCFVTNNIRMSFFQLLIYIGFVQLFPPPFFFLGGGQFIEFQ